MEPPGLNLEQSSRTFSLAPDPGSPEKSDVLFLTQTRLPQVIRALCAAAMPILCSAILAAEPVRVIFDTDMDTDCDDAGALALLHALADNGEAVILATLVSSQKVKQWVCMGSRYPADLDPSPWGNFKPDPEATVEAIADWPTLITFTGGGDFANSVATGRRLCLETPPANPARRAYELYFGGDCKDRHSADQIAVMIAVRGLDPFWHLATEGHNHIFSNGTHEWRVTSDNPNHQYVSALRSGVNPKTVAQAMENLMVQPPKVK
jgi:hypothetical protein